MNHFGNVPKTSTLTVTKNTSTQADTGTPRNATHTGMPSVAAPPTFVEFFSKGVLKPQDILTQEQIKSLDVQFPDAGSGIDGIGLPILILVAIGVDFGAAVQYAKDEVEIEKYLTEEQLNQVGELFEKIGNSFVTGGKLPDELLEGGAFSITTKEKAKKAKVKKVIIIGVGATALIGGLIFLARKK